MTYTATEGIGALKLAMEAGADDRARMIVTRAILEQLPDPEPGDTGSVRLLLDAIRGSKVELRVTDHKPSELRRRARGGVR